MARMSLNLISSTVTGNCAAYGGGGIFLGNPNGGYTGTAYILNSIVANNEIFPCGAPPPYANPSDIDGVVTAKSSLIGTNEDISLTDLGGNQIGSNGSEIDPMLLPLADNGGPTWTHALMPGSPAINAGDPAAVAGVDPTPLYDQRGVGFPRVIGPQIDLGAFEYSQTLSLDGDIDVDGDDLDTLCLAIQNMSTDPLLDIDGNGAIESADLVEYLALIGSQFGDANLDGNVDVSDFNIWNQHKFTVQDPALPDVG